MAYKWPVVEKVKDENPWVSYMKKQVHVRNNCINGVFVGQPGSGKSWAMLSLASMIDPDFELEGNWFFKAGDMMRAMRRDLDKHQPGKLWLYDEAGIDLNNMKFYDEINKGLNAFFQTARHRNYIFLCSVPYLNFISKGVRTLMTATFKADGWKDNKTILHPRVMEFNGDLQKIFYKRLFVKDKTTGNYCHCNRLFLPPPPVKLRHQYEKLKKEFTANLFNEISDKIDNFEKKEEQKGRKKALSLTQEQVLELLKKGMLVPEIAKKLNKTVSAVQGNIASLKRNGIRVIPVRDTATKQLGKMNRVIRYEIKDYRPGIADPNNTARPQPNPSVLAFNKSFEKLKRESANKKI